MTTLQQLEADKKQETVSSTLGANEMRVCKATNSKGLAFTSSPSTDLSCCSSEHHQPLKRNIMEENIRMRQALNGVRKFYELLISNAHLLPNILIRQLIKFLNHYIK